MTAQERTDWLAKRRLCVTGTDVAGILGISPWATPMSVYIEKTDPNPIDKGELEEQTWGKRLEPVIANYYADRMQCKLDQGKFTMRDFDGLPAGGTPDFLRTADKIVIECKTSRTDEHWGDEGTDDIPPYYICQTTWYAGILGYDMAHVAALIGWNDIRDYEVRFDPELFGNMIAAARTFWHLVTERIPPPIDDSKACRQWISRRFRGKGNFLASPADVLVQDIVSLRDVSQSIRLLESDKATLQNRILEGMGEFDKTALQGVGRISVVRGGEVNRTDWKACCEAAGVAQDVISRHTTKSQRASYLKPTWDKE